MTTFPIFGGLLLAAACCFAACPDPPAISDLDLNKVAGKWYGYKLPAEFETVYKCGSLDLKPKDETLVDYLADEYDIPNSKWKYLKGAIQRIGSGKFEGFRVGFPGSVKVSILGTDYSNWLVFWQCHETNEKQWAFVMSRNKTLSPNAAQEAEKSLPPGAFAITDQSNCPSKSSVDYNLFK